MSAIVYDCPLLRLKDCDKRERPDYATAEDLRQLRESGEIFQESCGFCNVSYITDPRCKMRVCAGPIGLYCVCGECFKIPAYRHGLVVL